MINYIDLNDIKPGVWILKERLTYSRFGHPVEVTKVSAQRIYYRRPRRNRDGTIENYDTGYCALKSVLRVVDSEALGMAAWDEQMRLSAILEAEQSAALKRFHDAVNEFFILARQP